MSENKPPAREGDPALNLAIDNYLDGVGNHEIKLLVGGLFLVHADHIFTAAEMADKTEEAQGTEPALPIRTDRIEKYCLGSLEPVAELVTGDFAWQANPQHLQERLALTAVIGKWSLRWEDISIQQLYGRTTTAPGARSPHTRQNIYEMVQAATEPVAIADVLHARGGQYTRGGFTNQIDAVVSLGILQKDSGYREAGANVRIRSVDYAHPIQPLSARTAETQAVYAAFRQFGAGAMTSVEELVKVAASIDPAIDQAKLRQKLLSGLGTGNAYHGLELTEKGKRGGKLSMLEIAPAYDQPIAELTKGIAAVRDGSGVEDLSAEARVMLGNREMFRTLTMKGAAFFSARTSLKVTFGHLKEILGGGEELGVDEVRGRLRADYQQDLSKYQVRDLLNLLVERKVAAARKESPDGRPSVGKKWYRLSDI